MLLTGPHLTVAGMKRSSLLAPLLVLALTGCGSGSHSSSAPTPSPAVHATIRNFTFVPGTIHVKVGQTVEWVNEDAAPHNVSYVSGPKFRSSTTLTTGASFSLTLTRPGTIQYFCSIHPWMMGTIVVSP
jgi:amicyanin